MSLSKKSDLHIGYWENENPMLNNSEKEYRKLKNNLV